MVGAGAALHGLWRRGYERALGVADDHTPEPRSLRDIGQRLAAAGITGVSPLVGYALVAALDPSKSVVLAAAAAGLIALPVPIFEASRRLLSGATDELLGPAPERPLLPPAPTTRLIGVAVDVGEMAVGPLSNRACLAASLVAVASDGSELGRIGVASELGLKVGDNMFVVCGDVQVTGEKCDYAMPAQGARLEGTAAALAAEHVGAELQEFTIREGDRIEALVVETHRVFNEDYRNAGEGRVLRGATVTRMADPGAG